MKFKVKDMGKLSYCLGVKIEQDEESGSMWIGQPLYKESILRKFRMDEAKPIKTPVNVSVKLTQADEKLIRAYTSLQLVACCTYRLAHDLILRMLLEM